MDTELKYTLSSTVKSAPKHITLSFVNSENQRAIININQQSSVAIPGRSQS